MITRIEKRKNSPSTFTESNDVFDMQKIQNRDQIFSKSLQWRKCEAKKLKKSDFSLQLKTFHFSVCYFSHSSESAAALSACPGTSMWMKHERSLISVMHGLLTKSWNDESIGQEPIKLNIWFSLVSCKMKNSRFVPKSWTVKKTARFSCWVKSPYNRRD